MGAEPLVLIGWCNGGQSPPDMKYVQSPDFFGLGGAVRTDLYAKAPHSSDNSVHCTAGSAACQQRQFWSLLMTKVTSVRIIQIVEDNTDNKFPWQTP